jgi:hypothetical protein
MAKQPWMKFYPTDWRADPALRMCSLMARGLWMEMLALMHQTAARGDLLINGRAPTPQQLATLVGADAETVETALAELESAGVFSRRKNGVIYSRRMERDEIKSSKMRANGKKGGNPSLCSETENDGLDNQEDKPRDKTQKPEARSQKPDIYKLRFDEWYEIYPRHVGKGAAEKAYAKALKDVDPETLIERARRFAAKPPDDPKFIPHPATWLNQKRWEDENLRDPPTVNGHGESEFAAQIRKMGIRTTPTTQPKEAAE